MTPDNSAPILLVDDFEDGRELYSEYLAFHGFRVQTAPSGEEAIRAIEAERPSVVLMDISMRGLNGTETMRIIRDRHLCDGVAIIAFTAFALEGERTQALADGFNAVITKPCLPDELMVVITSVLAGEPIGAGLCDESTDAGEQ